MVLEAKSHV